MAAEASGLRGLQTTDTAEKMRFLVFTSTDCKDGATKDWMTVHNGDGRPHLYDLVVVDYRYGAQTHGATRV
jgi:hypothetical protein